MAAATRLFVLEDEGPRCVAQGLDAAALADLHGRLAAAVYSGARTYRGRHFLELAAHLDRCERSARVLGFSVEDLRAPLCGALDAIATACAPRDSRFQFHLAPEPVELHGARSRVWITVMPMRPVPEDFLRVGVGVDLAAGLQRTRPLVKSTAWVRDRDPLPLGSRERYEHLLVEGQDSLLEGSSSNFFVVLSGRLVTAGSGVLEGITRGLILRLAGELGIEVELRAPPLGELASWDEAFLTSSSRGVVPIVRVAGRPIGSGQPGPVTARLRDALDELSLREARPAV